MDNQFSNKWYEELARDLKSGAKAPAAAPAPVPFMPDVPPAPIAAADEFAFDFADQPDTTDKKDKKGKAKAKSTGKKKKKSDPVTNIILALSILIFLGSSGYLAYNFIIQPILLERQMSKYVQPTTSNSDLTKQASNGIWEGNVVKEEAKNRDGTLKAFDKSRAQNSDIVGWITIPNTPVNYPVTKTKNNSYYLNHNVDKQENAAGCPFLDYRNVIKKDEMSRCSIIYGHHRRNGTMFGKLEYYNDLDFYKDNPVFTFDTIYHRYQWVVFANFRATADPATGNVFQYIKTEFKDDKEYTNFISAIRTRSLINTPVEVEASDDILLLSTCSYERANWRMVIAARKVRPDETTIDVSTAVKNPNPLMP